ncbi:hypothetical protein PoB_005012500 [Plakobranchus ocellatus]|uniref:Uncharacterized protein n=1 Tax=Plakobranchus ocellatus TaxID=259542 RepID=A0AAV4BT47_9GAST|nr:hypothetical protein PoB_005012500 [Plakobranchus ocellatus]
MSTAATSTSLRAITMKALEARAATQECNIAVIRVLCFSCSALQQTEASLVSPALISGWSISGKLTATTSQPIHNQVISGSQALRQAGSQWLELCTPQGGFAIHFSSPANVNCDGYAAGVII